jgi:hypothetical protein
VLVDGLLVAAPFDFGDIGTYGEGVGATGGNGGKGKVKNGGIKSHDVWLLVFDGK